MAFLRVLTVGLRTWTASKMVSHTAWNRLQARRSVDPGKLRRVSAGPAVGPTGRLEVQLGAATLCSVCQDAPKDTIFNCGHVAERPACIALWKDLVVRI